MELRKLLLISFAFSGMAALIYEIVWIRPIQFVLGSTVYTVSIILAAFMGGLALGSWLISKKIHKIGNLPKTYALMELGIGLYGVLLISIFNLLPKAYRIIYELSGNFYLFEFVQFLIIFLIILIPTTLMGATFPIIAAFYTKDNIGKSVGEIYSINTLGAIIGSLLVGFFLIPTLGIKMTIIFAALINIFIAFIILSKISEENIKKMALISMILFLIFSIFGSYSINALYTGGIKRMDFSEDLLAQAEFLYYKEGLHATVAVTKDPLEGARVLLINGYGQGSNSFIDLRVNILLASLPLLYNPNPKDTLLIGLGTGTTAGYLSQSTEIKTIEIEPAILEASRIFSDLNLNVLDNPNHSIIIDDARNYLLKDDERYDLIVSEPTNTWQSFSNSLFSKEFFSIINEHLSEEGLYVQWIPIYEMNKEDFRSLYRTFDSEFPYVIAFVNVNKNENLSYKFETTEILLIGSKKELNNNMMENFDSLPVKTKETLKLIKLGSPEKIENLLLFTEKNMEDYGENSKLITDDNMALEFSASKNILNQNPGEVMNDIEQFISR